MQSHSKATVPETTHAALNQVAYNQFWLEHSKLSLFQSTKFLAHRDLLQLLDKHLFQTNDKKKYRVLDFGCGAGETAQIINDLIISCDHEVELHCADINQNNLDMTRQKNPNGQFTLLEKNAFPDDLKDVDLLICNFVLLENSLQDLQKILEFIQKVLSSNGIAIITHNTAKVYDNNNDWVSFNTKFPENERDFYDKDKDKHTRIDGKPVKKSVLGADGKVAFTFFDFFYRRSTYKSAFESAKLELIDSHKPLGNDEDQIVWKSESKVPPYRIDVLCKDKKLEPMRHSSPG